MPYNDNFPLSTLLGNLTRYLPTWMEMRKNPESIGAQFLNVFALELEDVEEYLEKTLYNKFISTADLEAIDIIWKSNCNTGNPAVTALTNEGENITLQEVETIPEFYLSDSDVYILDLEKHLLYTKHEYVYLYIDDVQVKQELHNVWNHFDEFGLLLDTPRLYGETNREYKNRILSVFRFPANATANGVINGIGRHLGLVTTADWIDDSQPFVFVAPGAKLGQIKVDGISVDSTTCIIDNGLVKLLPLSTESPGMSHTVQYFERVIVNNLWDEEIRNKLYYSDGTARPKLVIIANNIQREVPTMWDEFIFDEAYWDVIDKEMSGIQYIPSIWDADIEIWRGQRIS